MAKLFSYGTLQHEQVQLSLFGRKLVGRNDALLGYELSLVRVQDQDFAKMSKKTHHAILGPAKKKSSKIDGVVLEVTDSELEIADKYEPEEYARVLAPLKSGAKAWVYIEAS